MVLRGAWLIARTSILVLEHLELEKHEGEYRNHGQADRLAHERGGAGRLEELEQPRIEEVDDDVGDDEAQERGMPGAIEDEVASGHEIDTHADDVREDQCGHRRDTGENEAGEDAVTEKRIQGPHAQKPKKLRGDPHAPSTRCHSRFVRASTAR